MNTLLTRIEQLAGSDVAQSIATEFGGTTCYVPLKPLAAGSPLREQTTNHLHASEGGASATPVNGQQQAPLRLVLHIDVHPKAEFGKASAAIEQAVSALRAFGLHTHEIGVQPDGLGDALIDALRSDAALGVPVNPTQAR